MTVDQLLVHGIEAPIHPQVVLNCDKIILTHDEVRIEIDNALLKNFSAIIINGRKYVLEDE